MNKLLVSLSLAAAIVLPVTAQTTNTTDFGQFLKDGWNFAVGQGDTNLDVAAVATYTPSLHKWGGAIELFRNVSIGNGVYVAPGFGVDYYDNNFYALKGGANLGVDLTPFASFGTWGASVVVSPFGFVNVGTPFGGNSSGNVELITGGGGALHLTKFIGGELSLIGIYGTRDGLGKASGVFYGAGLNQLWKF